jgi:DNA anti-recombination protein RmuC
MFTKRHEQELAEIKALIVEVGQSFQQVVERLERIQETQDQLAADQPAAAGKPTAGPAVVQLLDGAPESEDAGSKKARRRQPRAPAADAADAKSGKRRTRAPKAGGAGKRRDAGARKRVPPAEPALSSGSDEG